MPVLPVPMIYAFLLLFFLIRAVVRKETKGWLLALIFICALQSALVAFVHYYQIVGLRFVMPVTASLVSPLAWFAFLQTTQRDLEKRDLWHLCVPCVTTLLVWRITEILDVFLIFVFTLYAGRIAVSLVRGRDALLRTALGSGDYPLRLWWLICGVLFAAGLSDLLIWGDQILNEGEYRAWIIGVFSSLNLLALGGVALLPEISETDIEEAEDTTTLYPVEQVAENKALFEQLDLCVSRDRLYLDPDLTLAKMARKLGVPAKKVSAAINSETGENVSRYINGFRISYACTLLMQGLPVTSAMLDAGFNTKSNFNREFRRVKGCSPRDWIPKPS